MLNQELLHAKYISFATLKRDGSMVGTPVWAGSEDNSLFVFSEADAGKVKRLRNFSRSTVAPCTATGRVTGNSYDCEAFLLESDADIARAYKALNKKYGFLMRITDFFSKMTGRYDKRALIQIDVGEQAKPNS
ncbi:MAG: PPOX class F420-dependent oxidoreductase [Pseudomonadales bacterium]